MLPDFPVQKNKLMEYWTNYFVRKHREYLGFFSTLPYYRDHEGDRWIVARGDGTVSELGYNSIEADFSVHLDEVPNLTPEKIIQKIDSAAQEMARQMSQGIIADINRAVEEGGRTVNVGAQPFTKDVFLKALDSIELNFDEDGELDPPAIVMHPKVWESIKDDIKIWEQDPEFNTRYEEIIARKREAWRVRESRRKLVD